MLINLQEMCWRLSPIGFFEQDSQERRGYIERYILSRVGSDQEVIMMFRHKIYFNQQKLRHLIYGQINLILFQDIQYYPSRQDIKMKLPKNDAKKECFYDDPGSDESISDKDQHQNDQTKRSKLIRKTTTTKDNQTPPQSTKIGPKDDGDQQDQRSNLDLTKGRPQKNQQERRHQQVSQQLNHIYQHYAKFLIYFYMMKKQNDQGSHSFSLQVQQNRWINQATVIMSIDNFPSNMNERNQCFILHPNSLHFIFQFNKRNKVLRYSTEQIKFYFFAFLGKRGLLTSSIHNYICQYWSDIIGLLNEWTFQQNRARKEATGRRLYVQYEQELEKPSITRLDLQKELKVDSSIAAYEVACYLKCCCDHFGVQISPPRKQ